MKKEEFLNPMDNTCNHRVLLWPALELTQDAVIEFGSGHGSTPFLKQWCKDNNRTFRSYENNKEWAEKTGATLINNWDDIKLEPIGVLFIDHAPGERRKEDIIKWKGHAQIIVAHDTEPHGGGDYQMRQYFDKFDSVVEVKTAGAWATMLSDFVDLSKCIGKVNDEYSIEEYTG